MLELLKLILISYLLGVTFFSYKILISKFWQFFLLESKEFFPFFSQQE
jgi:hypothetical protein